MNPRQLIHRTNINRLWLMIGIAATLVAGCASSQGLHPDRLRAVLAQDESRFFGIPASDPATGSRKLSTPSALGLYLKPTGFLQRGFEWTDHDREVVLQWSKSFPLGPGGKSVGFVPLTSLKGDTFTELKASAARRDVDLLLVFDGAAAVDRYNNYKAPLLYWTILGAYFADGTESDALCLMKSSIWDVKTGALLSLEEAEGRARVVGPAAFTDDEKVLLAARQQAMTDLLAKLKSRLARPESR